MKSTLRASPRYLAIFGLWVLIGILIVPTWIAQKITGVGLSLIDPLKAKADELADDLREWL